MKFRSLKIAVGVFALIAVQAAGTLTYGQSAVAKTLEPPLAGLAPVHFPDVSDVEDAVRKQINGLQERLSERAKPDTPTADLSSAYGDLARVYHSYSFLEPAKECYENASKLSPEEFRWIYMLGKIAEQETRFSEAAALYKKALGLNPSYTAALVNLGNVYFELDSIEESENSFEKAISTSENDPAAIYGLGRIAFEQKNYSKAAEKFSRVLELVPGANRVHYSLALAYRGLGEVEKAKFHLDKQGIVGIRPADPLFDSLDANLKGVRLRLVNGKLAFQAKRYNEAETEFREALQLEPENTSALVNLGATLTQLGKGSEAINLFAKALSIEPTNTNARYNLAYLLLLKRDYLQAIGHYKIVLKENPKDVESRFRLGTALHRADLLREAASELVTVYNSEPDKESVILELSSVFTKIGEHTKAKELLIRSYQVDSTRGRTIAALSLLLASSPDRSLREGEKALTLSQLLFKSTGLLDHAVTVALSLAELGRCDEAESMTRDIINKAKTAGNQALATRLENILPRFVKGQPCRP